MCAWFLPAAVTPDVAALITSPNVIASVATAIQSVHTVGLAFVQLAEIVAREAITSSDLEGLNPIMVTAQSSEIMPAQVSFVLVTSGLEPFTPTDSDAGLSPNPRLAAMQKLATALINLGVMSPDINANAQQFIEIMQQAMGQMANEEGGEGGQRGQGNQGPSNDDNDDEEEAEQQNVANRALRDDEVD